MHRNTEITLSLKDTETVLLVSLTGLNKKKKGEDQEFNEKTSRYSCKVH